MLRLSFLGRYEVFLDDKPIVISSRPDELLLAYLVLNADRSHSRAQVAGIIWPDSLESTARKNLRNAIWRLRQAIGSNYILASKSTLAFDRSQPYRLDVDLLEADPADVDLLIEAAAAFQGELLPGCYDDWVQLKRQQLNSLYGRRMQQLLSKLSAADRWSDVFSWAESWIARGEVPEPAYRYLMRAYAAGGDLSGVASTYRRCVEALKNELGVEPSAETRDLYEWLLTDQKAAFRSPSQVIQDLDPSRRYIRESLLALGGQGEVYLGRDELSGEHVVIKHLLPELGASDPAFIERFVREGKVLALLNHPNIVRMIAAFEQDGQPRIVMEYVPGGSLRELLDEEGRQAVERTVDICLELVDALSRTHHLGIIHRDIKPGNVLLAADGTPRLTDFVVARVEIDDSRLTRNGSVIGSPAYISPEALAGKTPDERSDIWSFGVLLFELLTGENPFQSQTVSETMAAVLTGPIPALRVSRPDCPEPLAALVERMLVRNPESRISSMRQVAAELEAIRAGRLIDAGYEDAREAPLKQVEQPAPRPSMPISATPFIGRERETDDLQQLLAEEKANRLITIVGPGGIGKSRLALEAAAAAADWFDDGVYFVPLAPLESADHIVSLLAEILEYRFWGSSEPRKQLLDYISTRKLLLVADNFEHVLAGVELLSEIIQKAPGVKILATSRERLNLSAEIVYYLGGMTYPDVTDTRLETDSLFKFGAIRLMQHHAQMLRPDHVWGRDEMLEMARICRQVQGMPLAIILAAGWLEVLSLGEIADEIAQSLDILESDLRDLPDRQRSVRAAFEYSWRRLPADAQKVFEKLSVFRGGFSRKAAQSVGGADLRTLRSLTEKSFLSISESQRYEIHELLRQFTEEKLELSGVADLTRDNHSTYYLQAVAARETDLKGSRQLEALDEIEGDFENVRAAWNWAVKNGSWNDINRSSESIYLFFDMRSRYREGVKFFAKSLDDDWLAERDLLRGRLTARQSWLRCRFSTDVPEIGAAAEYCLAIAGENASLPEIAFAKMLLGYHQSKVMTDDSDGLPFFEESLALYQDLGDSFHAARNLHRIGYCYGGTVGLEKFVEFTRMSLDLALEIGDKFESSIALGNLASASFGLGDLVQAKSYSFDSLALAEEIGDQASLGHTAAQLGVYYLLQGELDEAREYGLTALRIGKEIGFAINIAYALAVLSGHAALTGDYPRARELGEESLAIPSNEFGIAIGTWVLAMANTGLKNYHRSRIHIAEGVEICMQLQWPGIALWFFPIEALILAREGRSALAAQMLSLAVNHPMAARSWIDRWELTVDLEEALLYELGPEQFEDNWQKGKELDLLGSAAEIVIDSR